MSADKYFTKIERLRALYSSVESDSEGLLPECSISVKEARSEDDSSRSTHGNLCLFYCKLPVFISLAGQTLTTDRTIRWRLLTDGMHSG